MYGDILGRAGRVGKALDMVGTMPCHPDRVVWTTLLGACRKWKSGELGRRASESALGFNRSDATDLMPVSVQLLVCMTRLKGSRK